MSFWSDNEAAPHWIYTCLPKAPRFLRTHPAKPRTTPSVAIRRARPDDVGAVAAFWRAHYKGDDWYMDARPEWVRTYVCDPSVIVLVAYDATAQLIATIVSTPLNGTVYMSHSASLRNTVRVIEGLVVHSAHRGKGVAGAMIHEMDVLTSTRAPTCHLWSREIPYEPFVTTAIQTSTYAYIPCGAAAAAVAHATATRAPWADFQRFWTQHVASVLRRRTPYLVLDTVNTRRDDMTVWKVVVRECVHIVVVSNTRRKQVSTDAPVFELVWIGAPQQTHVREALECVAAQLASGVLFVSCADETWPSPWQYGTSGAHAWYMYNYMPPAFGSVEIHAIREEL